jgi:hypothetical protein
MATLPFDLYRHNSFRIQFSCIISKCLSLKINNAKLSINFFRLHILFVCFEKLLSPYGVRKYVLKQEWKNISLYFGNIVRKNH